MRGIPGSYKTAELVRESASASFTTKISFINEVATLCEQANAVHLVSSISISLGSYSNAHSCWTPKIPGTSCDPKVWSKLAIIRESRWE